MSERELKYYNMGQQARSESLSRNAAVCVFSDVDRSWYLAGWHDKDIEISGRRVF